MLNKKYQVLVSSWMEDYIKLIAKRYDLNISAVIRTHMCLGFLYVISSIEPEFKTGLQGKEIAEFIKKANNRELQEEDGHHLLSKIVFETRKAVEYRLPKEKKLQKSGY